MSSHSETSSILISHTTTVATAADCLKIAGDQGMATVLVVDDEPKLLELRRLMLETMGYPVLVAESGEKALEIMRTGTVDVVILDYLMPGMDGEATARGIRALNLATPIILSTACLSVPERVLRLVTAFVPKGMAPMHLMEVLREELQRAHAGMTREFAEPAD